MDTLFVLSCFCLLCSLFAVGYVVHTVKKIKPPKKETERRIKDYPSTYPYGWYKLADSRTLKAGDLKHIETCGKQLIVFRGREDKKVGVLDALCIHLGANISVGGKVVGDCVQCPFHLWEFDASGKCQKIPYQENIPDKARTNSYTCIEYYGLVLVWLDPLNRPPLYHPPTIPDMDAGEMVYCDRIQRDIGMHLLEIAENSADWRHFETLHNIMKIPYTNINLPIRIIHKSEWKLGDEDSKDPYLIHFRDTAHIVFRGKDVPNTTAVADITFVGPSSLMLFKFDTPAGKIVLFQTHLPIDHLTSHAELVWYREKRSWRALVWYVVGNWISQWQNDLDIWENKTFLRKPFLVKGDGPVMKLRRWFFRFYNDPQIQIEYEAEDKKNEDMPHIKEEQQTNNFAASTLTKRNCSVGSGLQW